MNIEKLAKTAKSIATKRYHLTKMTPEILDATRALRRRGFALKVIYEALKQENKMPFSGFPSFYASYRNRDKIAM